METRHMQERNWSVACYFAFIWSPQRIKLFWKWGQSEGAKDRKQGNFLTQEAANS